MDYFEEAERRGWHWETPAGLKIAMSVIREYDWACANRPWPKDVVHAAAKVAEEAGELVKAANDHAYPDEAREGESLRRMRLEAVQVIVTGIRFLEHVGEEALI